MNDILRTLQLSAKDRVEEMIGKVPFMTMAEMACRKERDNSFPFEKMLARPGIQFICECKKASPSKGVIAEEYPYLEIAKEYEAAGAAAVSVLTEPTKFLGSIDHLKDVAGTVGIPVLRKDFVVHEYMIYEAKVAGASACLLIVSLLSKDNLKRFISLCDFLGMSALVECHEAGEIATALECGARVIGVNNRDLRTFKVNLGTSLMLRQLVPKDVLFVAESGISTPEDVARLAKAGVDAVLVGESFMRSPDKKAKLQELRGSS